MSKTKTKEPTANGQLTPDEMRQALAANQAEREQECGEAVNAVLKRFDCEIVVMPGLTPDGRITASATIKAR